MWLNTKDTLALLEWTTSWSASWTQLTVSWIKLQVNLWLNVNDQINGFLKSITKKEQAWTTILVWNKKIQLSVLMRCWLEIINQIMTDRDSIEDWKEQINKIILLFSNTEDLKSRIYFTTTYLWAYDTVSMIKSVIWVMLLEDMVWLD